MVAPHLLTGVPVLYEDPAPKYSEAMYKVSTLGPEDVLLVIGASTYTGISVELRQIAEYHGATVVEVQNSAKTEVRKELQRLIAMGG